MGFYKSTFWSSLVTGINISCGLVTVKFVAVKLGPSGMAQIGQFTNTTALLSLLASGALSSGVVKYVAQHKEIGIQKQVVNAAFAIILPAVVLTSLSLLLSAKWLSLTLFDADSFTTVIQIYALFIFFMVFNSIGTAILNGLQQIKKMAILGIGTSVLNMALVIAAATWVGINGVLLAAAASSFLIFFFYYLEIRSLGLIPELKKSAFHYRIFGKKLLAFSMMALLSGALTMISQLVIRTYIIEEIDIHAAGIWQANIRLSDYYINFFNIVLGIYYLPKLSEIKDNLLLKKEITSGYIRIVPVVIFVTLIIWLLRDFVVGTLLSRSFSEVLVLLKWQLIGDVIRISSWLLAFLMVAKALTKTYIVTEIAFAICLVLLTILFVKQFGLVGTVYAFALNYSLYLVIMIFISRKWLSK